MIKDIAFLSSPTGKVNNIDYYSIGLDFQELLGFKPDAPFLGSVISVIKFDKKSAEKNIKFLNKWFEEHISLKVEH